MVFLPSQSGCRGRQPPLRQPPLKRRSARCPREKKLGLDAWTISELRLLLEALHGWIADLFEAVEARGAWPSELVEPEGRLLPCVCLWGSDRASLASSPFGAHGRPSHSTPKLALHTRTSHSHPALAPALAPRTVRPHSHFILAPRTRTHSRPPRFTPARHEREMRVNSTH